MRQLEVTTRSFGLSNNGVFVPGDAEADDLLDGGRRLAYLPSSNHRYQLWYKRHWMSVERQSEGIGYQKVEKLNIWYATELLFETKADIETPASSHTIIPS